MREGDVDDPHSKKPPSYARRKKSEPADSTQWRRFGKRFGDLNVGDRQLRKTAAVKHGNDFRTVIESDIYRKVFPNIHIAKNTESEVTTTAGGCRIATSVDGPITGRGCDIAIIDDPLKPGEALSDARCERINNWYYQTFLSRLDDPRNAAIILVTQRLHQDDLAGTLLRSPEDWFYLKLPAIATCNETIPIGPNLTCERREGDPLHALLLVDGSCAKTTGISLPQGVCP